MKAPAPPASSIRSDVTGRPFGRWVSRVRARPLVAATVVGVGVMAAATVVMLRPAADSALAWTVQRGTLIAELTEPGTLRATRSVVYRSPINGRELEIVSLVPEGTRVAQGDLVVRLETSELEAELERAVQAVQAAELAVQVSDLELLEATAGLESTVTGAGALGIDETRTRLELAEKRVDRLHREVENLEPLLSQGFITGDELERSRAELEAAEAELTIARRRASVLIEQTHPIDTQRAELQLAQRRAQREGARHTLTAARRQVADFADRLERCSMYAESPGLVVYEEFMASSPRRKIRLGDRVTPSQGIVRIAEVSRMLVDTSVPERLVHRVLPGQPVAVRLEAYPDLRLSGRVTIIGTLARASDMRSFEGKRFDLVVELDATDADLRPEMTARVDILVGERHDAVLLPLNAVFEYEGVTVVNVLDGRRVETRQVELGEQNQRFVEAIAGVEDGEQVMLVGTAPDVVTPAAGMGPGGRAVFGAFNEGQLSRAKR